MRALLLAAGLGTRLKPITNSTPKCLVPIRGKPLLGIWLESLARAGMGPFLVNTHYFPDQVKEYLRNSPYQNRVTLVHEQELLGTAGTLIANLKFFGGEDGFLIHADNYCLADFSAFAEAHRKRPPECVMTMLTFRTNDPSSCGIVELDERGVVVGFHEKVDQPPGDLANGAVYILSHRLMDMLATDLKTVKDFSTEVLNRFVGSIYTYHTERTFVDIGTPMAYNEANNAQFLKHQVM